ncbi:branched-chain amino acid ABC transporter permease [Kribbella sandramycini]|uniref:Branched-chain amino acid ABC transporter permease n=1 Tax=Kribbella sandramycini TaxID=60450 RepID=A0A7Y4NY71_9ACTN|nr:branched-chain amino acid ABC transporter permease [Kribbella sandramycini]MBB6568773.1 branched-chain amino acid transport system permease protein [Kribbella sandramycini]NOL38644.1 branched-chain amino acid ABC transporter permease [Kribbella sandramycini]
MTDVQTETPAAEVPAAPKAKPFAWPLGLVGVALVVIGSFLSWSYDGTILNNLSINFYPGGLQILAIVAAVLALVLLLAEQQGPLSNLGNWLDATLGLRVLGTGLTLYMALVLVAISVESDGLINVNPGGYVSFAGAALLAVGAWLLPLRPQLRNLSEARTPAWLDILAIAVLMAALLFVAAYALGLEDAWSFILCLLFVAVVATALFRTGAMSWVAQAGQRHRKVLTLASFAVAFLFPFTQNGSDANMSIATAVLVFGATAMGLNIVVGLAGLLDLGYIAFLGSGAYVAATLSTSAFATIGWKPPFLVVVLVGACVAAVLGLIIGSPTLRVSGDYLAIVTLGFGEIFRFAMFNLDGNNGPNLTNGPNGIPGIPDLEVFGFNFGVAHHPFGIELGRFSNYYFLLLVLIGGVILAFTRLNNSRIGRGWVAIREDEKAAEAMGVNVFGLKLLAFAVGAFLAGLAGTIKAHQDGAVSPDQYIFLESAFLLAAIVLGGMGTIAGVLLGATILKLLPEKLRFFSEYRLLLFGVLLVLMMRFRPEGLVASRRRQLEFHEEDEELAEAVEHKLLVEEAK